MKLEHILKSICFSYFFSWAIFLNFFLIIAKQGGLDSELAQNVSVASFFARTFGLLFFYPILIDKLGTKGAGLTLTFVSLLSCVALLFSINNPKILITSLIILATFLPIGLPITETVFNTAKLNPGSYENIRIYGSIGFIVSLIVASFSYNQFYVLVGAIILSMVVCFFSFTSSSIKNMRHKVSLKGFPLKELYIFFIIFLIQGAHAGFYVFGAVHFLNLGYSSIMISLIFIVGIIAEILIFKFLSGKQNIEYKPLLLVAIIASIVRWGVMVQFYDYYAIFSSAILHGATFGLTHISFIRFIKRNNNDGAFISSAFLIYGAFIMSLSLGFVAYLINTFYTDSYFTIPLNISIIALVLLALNKYLKLSN